jgi:hypothetical protein
MLVSKLDFPQLIGGIERSRDDYERTLVELKDHRLRLHELTRRYPLIADIGDERFVSESPEEIDALILAIEMALDERGAHILKWSHT